MTRGKQQNGYVIVVVTALLVVLLGFAAFAVDIGILYGSRTALQRAADAAALAGAYTFISEPTASQPATAIDRARSTAYQNGVLGSYIKASEVTVTVDTTLRRVTVDVTHNENTFFAKALSWTQATLRVEAIAEASNVACAEYCTKPWFLPDIVLSDLLPCTARTNNEMIIDSAGNVTTFGKSMIAQGRQFTVKPSDPNQGGQFASGNFFEIDLPDSKGGNDYRTNIAECTPVAVRCGNSYGVLTGNKIGPSDQGVKDLTTIFGTVSPDYWIGTPGSYGHPDGRKPGPTSHQLIGVPIWDSSTVLDCDPASKTYNQIKPGTTPVLTVRGFATIFLEGMGGGGGVKCESYIPKTQCGGNDIIGRLVGLAGCGSGSAACGDSTGPLSLPLRLIRTD